MRFRHELSYDAPPERVFAMLADPEFRKASCEALEKLMAEKVAAGMDVEHGVGVAWLKEH
jgi:hypothetical protein